MHPSAAFSLAAIGEMTVGVADTKGNLHPPTVQTQTRAASSHDRSGSKRVIAR